MRPHGLPSIVHRFSADTARRNLMRYGNMRVWCPLHLGRASASNANANALRESRQHGGVKADEYATMLPVVDGASVILMRHVLSFTTGGREIQTHNARSGVALTGDIEMRSCYAMRCIVGTILNLYARSIARTTREMLSVSERLPSSAAARAERGHA